MTKPSVYLWRGKTYTGQRAVAEAAGVAEGTVSSHLRTHGHLDHISGLKEVREATGAKVYMAAEDAERLTHAVSAFFPGPAKDFGAADVLVEEGAISAQDLNLFKYADDPQQAWDLIQAFFKT